MPMASNSQALMDEDEMMQQRMLADSLRAQGDANAQMMQGSQGGGGSPIDPKMLAMAGEKMMAPSADMNAPNAGPQNTASGLEEDWLSKLRRGF